MMIFLFMAGGVTLVASVILAVMFAPVERFESTVSVAGKPLAIEAVSCQRVKPEKPVYIWDSVDQHWGEARWMMETG